jgi:hypothetical protein
MTFCRRISTLLAQSARECKRDALTLKEPPVPQDAEEQAPLSVHRAFVVHFRTSTDITQGQIAGRVEHVVSGQATHFASLEELLAFIARVLTTVRAPPRRKAKR